MSKDKPLSEKKKYSYGNEVYFFLEKDVKKAVEDLKKIIKPEHEVLLQKIDKIFGEFE